LRPVFLICLVLVISFSVAGTLVSGQWKFWFGMLAGATMTFYLAARESPPAYIENWRLGSEGERRTAKALRPLARNGWDVRHDIEAGRGNFDHVVVGDAGAFLLDSKNYGGEATLEDGVLKIRRLDDPDDSYTRDDIVRRMRAAAAELKARIAADSQVRVWVQPVVVLWARFPERATELSGVFFVHGEALAEWLRGRASTARQFDRERVREFLKAAPRAHDRDIRRPGPPVGMAHRAPVAGIDRTHRGEDVGGF
jgi:Nuclease-related domain